MKLASLRPAVNVRKNTSRFFPGPDIISMSKHLTVRVNGVLTRRSFHVSERKAGGG